VFPVLETVAIPIRKDLHFHPGVNVGRGTDDTLFALQAGSVKFGSRRGRRVVDIVPAE